MDRRPVWAHSEPTLGYSLRLIFISSAICVGAGSNTPERVAKAYPWATDLLRADTAVELRVRKCVRSNVRANVRRSRSGTNFLSSSAQIVKSELRTELGEGRDLAGFRIETQGSSPTWVGGNSYLPTSRGMGLRVRARNLWPLVSDHNESCCTECRQPSYQSRPRQPS